MVARLRAATAVELGALRSNAADAQLGAIGKERNMMATRPKGPPASLAVIGLTTLLMIALGGACSREQASSASAGSPGLPGDAVPGLQVASVAELRQAQGEVFDWVLGPLSPTEPEIVEWLTMGRWVLDCNGKCVDANPDDIDFGMALAMTRPGSGERSHSHQFTGFTAKHVENKAFGDDLTIRGEVNFSPIGLAEITIEFLGVAKGNATFYFTLGEGSPFQARTGGVVIESR